MYFGLERLFLSLFLSPMALIYNTRSGFLKNAVCLSITFPKKIQQEEKLDKEEKLF